MKKILFTVFAAMAFTFAMTACNNNQPAEAAEDTTPVVEQTEEHHCAMDSTCNHECQCGDECKAKNCENCPNHGTENCCKAKASVEGQACEHQCEHACEHKCQKAEAQACEHKCEKAEGKECCKKAK